MKSSSGPWFVYLIRRSDGGFLTGVTPDPAIRIHPHTGGRRARPIPGELPVTLVYTEEHPSEELATARETEIRKWGPRKKEELLGEGFALASARGRRGGAKSE